LGLGAQREGEFGAERQAVEDGAERKADEGRRERAAEDHDHGVHVVEHTKVAAHEDERQGNRVKKFVTKG
jgi:hypothetical protein